MTPTFTIVNIRTDHQYKYSFFACYFCERAFLCVFLVQMLLLDAQYIFIHLISLVVEVALRNKQIDLLKIFFVFSP